MAASLVIAVTAAAGCPGPRGAKPASPKAPAGADPRPGGDGQRVTGSPAVAPTADLSQDLLVVVRASSLDSLLQAGSAYVAGQLPAPFDQMVQPQRLKEALLSRLAQMGDLDRAVDASRPAALAVMDPRVYGDRGLGPLILALPVLDPQALVDGLARSQRHHETTAWNDHRFGEPPRQVHLRFDKGHAMITGSAKLLAGATRLLRSHLDAAPARGIWARVNAERVNQRYAKEIERAVRRMSRRGYLGLSIGRRARRSPDKTLALLRSLSSVELSIGLEPKQIRIRAEALGKPAGAFADYLAKLGSGPAWGAEYLPADSALVMLARSTPAAQLQASKEAFEALQGLLALLPSKIGADLKQYPERWRKALEAVVDQATGVGASAIWATADGGIGLGGVYQAKDPQAVQRASVAALETIAKDLDRLLKLAASRANKGLSGAGLTTRVRRGAFRHGAVRGDLIQLSIRWPRINKRSARQLFSASVPEARAKLKRIKRGLRTLFGARGTVALVGTTTASGEKVCLMTAGRDYAKRLSAMLAVAEGKRTSGTEKTIAALVGQRPVSMVLHAPLASLLEQTMRVVDQLTPVPARLKTAVNQLLPPAGRDVPLALWMSKGQDKLVLEGSISSDLIGIAVKGVYFALRQTTSSSSSPGRP